MIRARLRAARKPLAEAQDASGLDAGLCLVATVRGQDALTPAADAFYKRVTWEGDIAVAGPPHDHPQSPELNCSRACVRAVRPSRESAPRRSGSTSRPTRPSATSPQTSTWTMPRRRALGARLRDVGPRRVNKRARPARVRYYIDALDFGWPREDPGPGTDRRDLPRRPGRPRQGRPRT